MNKKSKLTILFFTPHADDIELGVPFMYLESLKLENRVIEVLMTDNAYGTKNDEFKGLRLENIRRKELESANKIFEKYSNHKIIIHRMEYIDGHLPLNIESLTKIRDLIYKEKPSIIFAPDPWFAQDFHADHLNTGRLVYFSLKNVKKEYQPKKVLYYYSTKTHYYLKCNWSEFKIIKKALSKHKSQYSSLQSKLIVAFYIKLSIIKHFLETGKFSESFREQKFDKNRNPLPPTKFEYMSFRERIIYYLFSNLTIRGFVKFYNLSPRGIGFKINYNNRDVLKLLDKRYIYKYQINKEFKS